MLWDRRLTRGLGRGEASTVFKHQNDRGDRNFATYRRRARALTTATTLPAFLMNASAALIEKGLTDPRGCDYRAIEIGIVSVWSGDGDVARTRGWVLPATDGARTRFAVG